MRDWRRRREKKVGVGARALLAECRALANAEPVLLVDDGETEPFERDVLLDERVRADGHRDRSIGEPGEYFAPPLAGDARGEERVRRPPVREKSFEGSGVLLGKELGRRHQRGLSARGGRDPRGERRNDGLPEPTSPSSRRDIGMRFARSPRICSNDRSCAPVRAKGSSAIHREMSASGTESASADA